MGDQIWRMTETASNAYVVFPPFVSSEAFIGPGPVSGWILTPIRRWYSHFLMGLGQWTFINGYLEVYFDIAYQIFGF